MAINPPKMLVALLYFVLGGSAITLILLCFEITHAMLTWPRIQTFKDDEVLSFDDEPPLNDLMFCEYGN